MILAASSHNGESTCINAFYNFLTKIVTCWLFFCAAHSNNAREFLIFRGVLLDVNWNVWVLSPFSWKASKNFMFSFFDVSDICISGAERYWCYVFCWLKFLGFVDFPFQNSPILLGCSCYYGGFFWTWIETFWVLEPFLRRPQKILQFHFLACSRCNFYHSSFYHLFIISFSTKLEKFHFPSKKSQH